MRPAGLDLYRQHCAECHGADRLGGSGPALLPESLRLKRGDAVATIRRAAGDADAGLRGKARSGEISALADLIYRPLAFVPEWSMADIEASRVVHNAPSSLPEAGLRCRSAQPLHGCRGGRPPRHHPRRDRFEPLWRFPSRFALHGGAKYSPDGRFVYLGSRDGWVGKYDLWG